MVNLIKHGTYKIAGVFLPAIINDDYSGLEESDETQLNDWLKTLPQDKPLTFDVSDDQPEFTRDVVSGLMADCYTVKVWVPETVCKILSIDAWRDSEGGWAWNNWYSVGEIELAATDWKPRKLLKWFRDNGYLKESSAGKCAIEDDGYNIVILERGNRRPVFAVEYGPRVC